MRLYRALQDVEDMHAKVGREFLVLDISAALADAIAAMPTDDQHRLHNNIHNDIFQRLENSTSDSQGRRASDPTPDILALEKAAESLTRHGDISNAIALWTIALRLRGEIGCPVT